MTNKTFVTTDTAKSWNDLSITKRKKLLREIGYNPNAYAYRAFEFIPAGVREDVDYTLRMHSELVH